MVQRKRERERESESEREREKDRKKERKKERENGAKFDTIQSSTNSVKLKSLEYGDGGV